MTKNNNPIRQHATKERVWRLGFGPIALNPGEKRIVDAQPKCYFRGEKILSLKENADVHLLAIYVGRTEILNLGGDSIELSREEIAIGSDKWCDPSLPIEVEIVNRGREPKKVLFDIMGTARL